MHAALLALLLVPSQDPAPLDPGSVAAAVVDERAACEALGRRIEEAVAARDPDRLAEEIDFDAIVERALEGFPSDSPGLAGFRDGLGGGAKFCTTLIESFERDETQFDFMRLLDAPRRLLFRHFDVGGVGYIEFEVAPDEDGTARAVDMYQWTTGQSLSEQFRWFALPLVWKESVGDRAASRLGGKESAIARSTLRIRRMFERLDSDPAGAMKVYDSLPQEVKFEPFILAARVQIAFQLGDDEYIEALDAFEKHHPESPALDLLLVDRAVIAGDHPAVLRLYDALDAKVGGDPFLDVLRAATLVETGDVDRARTTFERAIRRDARLESVALWSLVGLELDVEDFVAVYQLLVRLDRSQDLAWNDLTEAPHFAKFVQSPAYRRWLYYLENK
ncbi:MAG: hypothetical protein R3F34_11390 [Planctomycetota bacterium]